MLLFCVSVEYTTLRLSCPQARPDKPPRDSTHCQEHGRHEDCQRRRLSHLAA